MASYSFFISLYNTIQLSPTVPTNPCFIDATEPHKITNAVNTFCKTPQFDKQGKVITSQDASRNAQSVSTGEKIAPTKECLKQNLHLDQSIGNVGTGKLEIDVPNVYNKVDNAPYEPRKIEQLLQDRYPESKIVSNTLPELNQKNVKLAGRQHPKTGTVYDNRGLAVFDDAAIYDTKISLDLVKETNPHKMNKPFKQARDEASRIHMKAATQDLRNKIEQGVVDKNKFTDLQLKQIFAGEPKIKDYTWHHHQDTGRMQLMDENLHKAGHIGGMNLWYK